MKTRSPAVLLRRRAEEVIEADVVERRGRSEARDVAALRQLALVGVHHHRRGVPAHHAAQPPLELGVARRRPLAVDRNGVHVRGGGLEREVQPGAPRVVDHRLEQVVRALRSLALEHGVERLDPLAGLTRVEVAGGVRHRFGRGVARHLAVPLASIARAIRAGLIVHGVLGAACGRASRIPVNWNRVSGGPEVAVARADVVRRRGARAAAQHALVVHELAVVLHQRAVERLVARVGLVVARGPLPDVAPHLERGAVPAPFAAGDGAARCRGSFPRRAEPRATAPRAPTRARWGDGTRHSARA